MEFKDYRKELKYQFLEKKKKNDSYSLRAFARDLNLSVTVLHGVLNEERHLSKKNLEMLATKLGWTDHEIQTARIGQKLVSDPTQAILAEDEFHLISDWIHLAILNLSKIKDVDTDSIPNCLGISKQDSQEAIERLMRLNFIEMSPQKTLIRKLKPFGTTQDVSSRAIRTFHYQNLEKAKTALEEVTVERRDFLTIAAATDELKVQVVKKKIQEFRKEILSILESDNPDRVYFLNLQLYPVSKEESLENHT